MGFSMPLADMGNTLSTGRVRFRDGDACLVCGEAGMVRAERAAGCLLVPEGGDKVLLALTASGEAWILAVLERASGSQAELRLPDSTALVTNALDVKAGTTAFFGKSLMVREDFVNIETGVLTMGGRMLIQCFATIRRMARTMSEAAVRMKERYGTLSQHVEDVSERKAGRVREESLGGYRVRAGDMNVKAKGQMDLDASAIKIG